MDDKRKKLLYDLQKALKIRFRNLKLINVALTRRSFAVESDRPIGDNERLEFLGDAVLDLAISRYLYERYKDYSEGELSMSRARLVNEGMLACRAKAVYLGKYLLLGKGELKSGCSKKDSILASALEAVIGAIYLDQGFDAAYKSVKLLFSKDVESVVKREQLRDPKGQFQEIVQKSFGEKPLYRTIQLKRFSNSCLFRSEAKIGKKVIGSGQGKTKKEAEEKAALSALKNGINNL